jgi:hypothetical protein
MKLSTDKQQYQTNIAKAADFGIEESDLSHIMGILRSQIYSDKLLAVIREYSTNAVDANIEAGKDARINVQLPSFADPTLSFRDHGYGLTDEEVCQLYVKYGASTKRNSNDYTGCLGIGCKAGFAYGDSFQVVSYTQNKITTWLARIDESKRGTISLLNTQENNTGSTGTEVRVTIRKQDIDDCMNKAKKFFKYWRTKPNINCEIPKLDVFESTDNWAITAETQRPYYRQNHRNAYVVMGNICYPLSADSANISGKGSGLIECNNVIFYAPLGALDIAANRESLEYTDRTRNALVAMSNNMLIDLASKLSKLIANQTSRINASIQSFNYDDQLPHGIVQQIKANSQWQGQELISNISLPVGHTAVKHYRKKKSWRSEEYVFTKDKDISGFGLRANMTICVHNTDEIPLANATRRIRTLQDNNNNNNKDVFVVIPEKALNAIKPKLEYADYTDLLDITPMPSQRTIITKADGTTESIKHVRINVCHVKPAALKSERLTEEQDPVKCEITGKYVYVPLDRYDWQGHTDMLDNLDHLQEAIKYMCAENKVPVINGVKKHYVKKVQDNDEWITLDAYYKIRLEQYAKRNPTNYLFGQQLTSNYQDPNWNYSLVESLQVCDHPRIARLAHVISQHSSNNTHGIRRVLRFGIQLKAIKQDEYFMQELEWLERNYPMLRLISSVNYNLKDKTTQYINNYINIAS